jgi:hypothetical protein
VLAGLGKFSHIMSPGMRPIRARIASQAEKQKNDLSLSSRHAVWQPGLLVDPETESNAILSKSICDPQRIIIGR